MKQIIFALLLLISLSGCSYHMALMHNVNSNSTVVELTEANFVVLDRVSGQASAAYVFGIVGKSNRALIDAATSDMLSKAPLAGKPRALVNLTTETTLSQVILPFYYRKTITVSGNVLEFTK